MNFEKNNKILGQLFTDQPVVDVKPILNEIKAKAFYPLCYQSLLIKHLRQAIFVEINSTFVYDYMHFLFEQLGRASSNAQSDDKDTHNAICLDIYRFFFKRVYLNRKILEQFNADQYILDGFMGNTIAFNSYDDTSAIVDTLKTVKYVNNSKTNSHVLIKLRKTPNKYLYLHENIFNLLVYLLVKVTGAYRVDMIDELFPMHNDNHANMYANCTGFNAILNPTMRTELFLSPYTDHNGQIFKCLLSELTPNELVDNLTRLFGIPVSNLNLIFDMINTRLGHVNDSNVVRIKLIAELSGNSKRICMNETSQMVSKQQVGIFRNCTESMDCLTSRQNGHHKSSLSREFFVNMRTNLEIKKRDRRAKCQPIGSALDPNDLKSINEKNLKIFINSFPADKSVGFLIGLLNNCSGQVQHNSLCELLIDVYVKVNKKFNNNFYDNLDLIFRNNNNNTTTIQLYLLSVCLFKFNMNQLDLCLSYLLDDGLIASERHMNATMILDFLWAIVYKPEFWRCMDHKTLMNSSDDRIESLFILDKTKLFSIVFCVLLEFDRLIAHGTSTTKLELKCLFRRRMSLVEHFLKNDANNCKINFVVDKLQEIHFDNNV